MTHFNGLCTLRLNNNIACLCGENRRTNTTGTAGPSQMNTVTPRSIRQPEPLQAQTAAASGSTRAVVPTATSESTRFVAAPIANPRHVSLPGPSLSFPPNYDYSTFDISDRVALERLLRPDLGKVAKSNGIKVLGTNSEIVERLLALAASRPIFLQSV